MGLLTWLTGPRLPTQRRRLPAEALTDLSSVELYDHLSEVIKLKEGDLDALYYVRNVVNHLIYRKTSAVEIGNGQAGPRPQQRSDQPPPRQDGGQPNQNQNNNHQHQRRR